MDEDIKDYTLDTDWNNVASATASCNVIQFEMQRQQTEMMDKFSRNSSKDMVSTEITILMGTMSILIENMHRRIIDLEDKLKTLEKYEKRKLNIS